VVCAEAKREISDPASTSADRSEIFRQIVRYESKEAPGTILIDPRNRFVYRIEGDGTATRYGANVGRDGFLWSGEAYVGRKAEWPTWTPPKEMIARQPEAAKYASGMPGGLENPLGARVLYLYKNGVYTVFTIYSTSTPNARDRRTSGCTGLLSQDMIDLYSRTPIKTKWSCCRHVNGVNPLSTLRRR